ncbi:MAG TPA: SRPBCC family protein [Pseudonocardia sp.]|nr:SRPBCC family protein [Pseudonocardia sp.]
MARVDIELPTGSKAELAKRLFAHVEQKTTDLAESTMEIDHRQYLDPELAAVERRAIFGRAPVVAAHGSELPNRSDFVTVQLPNNEVLVVRQADGSVRAFVNSCRHRGARLVLDDAGSRKMFTCGYHGWAYAGDGSLKVVPGADTFGDLDRSCRGLVELPCEERHGLVWVVDSREAELDVADWLGGELDATFTAYGLDSYICYRSGVFDEPINWKTLMDAFVDSYHLAVTHAGSVAPFFHSNLQVVDRLGRHGRAVTPRTSISKILDLEPDVAPIEDHVTVGYSVMPCTVFLRQPDHFQLMTYIPHPSDPGRCRMEIKLLIPEPVETEEQRAFWDKNWRILMAVIRDEDMGLNRHLQRSMANGDAQPLILGRNEIVNQSFHRWLDSAMTGQPDG